MKRFAYFNTHPAPHPKAPVCRLCYESIEYDFIIQLCKKCKKGVVEEKEFNDYTIQGKGIYQYSIRAIYGDGGMSPMTGVKEVIVK